MFTPENNDQHKDAVMTGSCSYCGAGPMELCKTSGGYIAQYEHADRRKKWAARAGTLGDRPNYSVVTPSKARVITIEMLMPTEMDRTTMEEIRFCVNKLSHGEHLAEVVADHHIEEDLKEAQKLLSKRRVTTWKT